MEYQEQLTQRQRRTFGNRLLKLARLIQSLKPAQYDHSLYITKYYPNQSCGTVACALGHAVASKQFKGLDFKVAGMGCDASIETNGAHITETTFDTSNDYFGPNAHSYIFHSKAFQSREPVKREVVQRIKQVARIQYGVK